MAQKQKKNKKWLFWVIIMLLFVVAAVVCYFVWDGYFKKKEEVKPVEEQSLVENKKESEAEKAPEVVEKEKETVVQYEGEDPNEREDLTGVVTYAGVNGNNLIIRVNIDQYLNSGSCELNLVQDSVAYSDTANIVSSATTATCEGFNVPVSRLSGGEYGIVIKISSGDKSGTINGEVRI